MVEADETRHSGLPIWRRLWDDRRGATAVEFALVAPPFFTLLFGIVEVALVFYAFSVMEAGVFETARQVRTGQIQAEESPAETFTENLCTSLLSIIDCERLAFSVDTFDSFSEVDLTFELDEDGNPVQGNFDPGGPSQIVAVRVAYRYDLFVPGIGALMDQDGDNSFVVVSTAVFRNEPFDDG